MADYDQPAFSVSGDFELEDLGVQSEPILNTLQDVQGETVLSEEPTVKLPVKSLYKVATPSKLELCRKWLADHPEDRQRKSRDLAVSVEPMGVKISHVTWNEALKEWK